MKPTYKTNVLCNNCDNKEIIELEVGISVCEGQPICSKCGCRTLQVDYTENHKNDDKFGR